MGDLASLHLQVDNYTRQGKVFQVLKPYQQSMEQGENQD